MKKVTRKKRIKIEKSPGRHEVRVHLGADLVVLPGKEGDTDLERKEGVVGVEMVHPTKGEVAEGREVHREEEGVPEEGIPVSTVEDHEVTRIVTSSFRKESGVYGTLGS